MTATKPAAMFALGDAVSIDSKDGATVQRYRVTGVEQVAGEYVVRFLPVTEPAKEGEDAEA
jgi:hypothetical protein